ncbi:MAG: DUF2840 domain-containing protein [Alphaproteobacteria bacterium]|nr:DUF2840 domain-containing protein [Alphaproteobacteria bacterium]
MQEIYLKVNSAAQFGAKYASRTVMSGASDQTALTRLTLTVRGKSANDRLLFGRAFHSRGLPYRGTMHLFEPGQVFGFVRWRGDGFGTQTWRVVVAEAGHPGEQLTRIPGIKPGVHVLLHAFGKTRAKRALRAIDMLSDAHVMHDIHPAYWRHVHAQIASNLPLDTYDPDVFASLDLARSLS